MAVPTMKSRKILDDVVGKFRILLETYGDGKPGLHDYGIPRLSWIRAVRFVSILGQSALLTKSMSVQIALPIAVITIPPVDGEHSLQQSMQC